MEFDARQIPDYVIFAVRSVAEQYGTIPAIKLLRSALSSEYTEYAEVQYYLPFRVGARNVPTLPWCRDYVHALTSE